MAAKQNKQCIGLVMNAVEWVAVEASGSAGSPVVLHTARIDVPAGLMKDGLITDLSAGAALLRQLLSPFSKAPLVVGVKNQNVLMRMASFPKVPPDKVRGMIAFQAQKFIPLPISELVLDYVECGESTLDSEDMLDVLLVGAKKNFLSQLILLMNSAGRVLLDVDSALLAATRGIIQVYPFPGEAFITMDVDHEGIGVMVCHNGIVQMARTVTIPDMLETVLQEHLPFGTFPPETVSEVAEILSGELQASVSYFTAQSGTYISRAYLRVFFPQAAAVAQKVSALMEMPVSLPIPYALATEEDIITFSTCISLACRGLEEAKT